MSGTKTPEYRAAHSDTYWTIAVRKPCANRFLRFDHAVSWDQATELARHYMAANPGMECYYTVNRQAELDGYSNDDDAGNILTHTGRRVRVVDVPTKLEGVTLSGHQHTPECLPWPCNKTQSR